MIIFKDKINSKTTSVSEDDCAVSFFHTCDTKKTLKYQNKLDKAEVSKACIKNKVFNLLQ